MINFHHKGCIVLIASALHSPYLMPGNTLVRVTGTCEDLMASLTLDLLVSEWLAVTALEHAQGALTVHLS